MMTKTVVALAVLLLSCTKGEPPCAQLPTVEAVPSSTETPPPLPSVKATTATNGGPTPQSSSSPTEPIKPATETSTPTPPLVDAEGKPLPQTEDKPSIDSPSFQQRIRGLCESIIQDDTQGAEAAFFPLIAYQQVKAIEKPERDYKLRLVANLKRDVHHYHALLGDKAKGSTCEGIEVPMGQARWMKPGTEGNRLGYFRVLRSVLKLKDATGKERRFEVTSLISWRGEWYLVHLNGFK